MYIKMSIKLIVVGVGPHARRIYLPALKQLQAKYDVEVTVTIELISTQHQTKEFFKTLGLQTEFFFVDPFFASLPKNVRLQLDRFVEEKGINGVIIATEPLSHKAYAEWALTKGLHILMDKPISSRKRVVSD